MRWWSCGCWHPSRRCSHDRPMARSVVHAPWGDASSVVGYNRLTATTTTKVPALQLVMVTNPYPSPSHALPPTPHQNTSPADWLPPITSGYRFCSLLYTACCIYLLGGWMPSLYCCPRLLPIIHCTLMAFIWLHFTTTPITLISCFQSHCYRPRPTSLRPQPKTK